MHGMDASLPLTNFDYYMFILCYSYMTVKQKGLSEDVCGKLVKKAETHPDCLLLPLQQRIPQTFPTELFGMFLIIYLKGKNGNISMRKAERVGSALKEI